MKRKWKVLILILAVIVIAGGVIAGVRYSKKGIVTVQTGHVVRQDLTAIVTASGEIKPRNYINIGTNAMTPSRIVEIAVTEGQRVTKGQLLARLDSVQPRAEKSWIFRHVFLYSEPLSPPPRLKPRRPRPP